MQPGGSGLGAALGSGGGRNFHQSSQKRRGDAEDHRQACQRINRRFGLLLKGTCCRPWLQFTYGALWWTFIRHVFLGGVMWWATRRLVLVGLGSRLVAAGAAALIFAVHLFSRVAFFSARIRLRRQSALWFLRPFLSVGSLWPSDEDSHIASLQASTSSSRQGDGTYFYRSMAKDMRPSNTSAYARRPAATLASFPLKVAVCVVFWLSAVGSPLAFFLCLSGAAPASRFDVCCLFLAAVFSAIRFFRARHNILLWGLLNTSTGPPTQSFEELITRASKQAFFVVCFAIPLSLVVHFAGFSQIYSLFERISIRPVLLLTGITSPPSALYALYRLAALGASVLFFLMCVEMHGEESFRVIHQDVGMTPWEVPSLLRGNFYSKVIAASAMAKAVGGAPACFPSNATMKTAAGVDPRSTTTYRVMPVEEAKSIIAHGEAEHRIIDGSRPVDVRFAAPPANPSAASQLMAAAATRTPVKLSRWQSLLRTPGALARRTRNAVLWRMVACLPRSAEEALALWASRGLLMRYEEASAVQSGVFAKHAGSTAGVVCSSWVQALVFRDKHEHDSVWAAYTSVASETIQNTCLCLDLLGKFTANCSGNVPLDLACQLNIFFATVQSLDSNLYMNPFATSSLFAKTLQFLVSLIGTSRVVDSVKHTPVQQPPLKSVLRDSRLHQEQQRDPYFNQENGHFANAPGGSRDYAAYGRGTADVPSGSGHIRQRNHNFIGSRLGGASGGQQSDMVDGVAANYGRRRKDSNDRQRLSSSASSGMAAEGIPSAAELEGTVFSQREKEGIFLQLQEMALPFIVLSILFAEGIGGWLEVAAYFPSQSSLGSCLKDSSSRSPVALIQKLTKLRNAVEELRGVVATSYTHLTPEASIHLNVLDSAVLTAISSIGLHAGLPLIHSDVDKPTARIMETLANSNGFRL